MFILKKSFEYFESYSVNKIVINWVFNEMCPELMGFLNANLEY